jgi:phosphate/sulfate permease
VQAACLVCLAHGSNDVANSITPLLVELRVTNHQASFAYWLGGIGISLGLLTLGYKVMETVGKNVIKLDFYKGFACQFATANCIILGSRLGIPLSTTHCMVGSLFGIALCNKLAMVKRTYNNLDFRAADGKDVTNQLLNSKTGDSDNPWSEDYTTKTMEPVRNENSINFGTVKKILFFWGLTVPVALGVSYGICKLLLINASK